MEIDWKVSLLMFFAYAVGYGMRVFAEWIAKSDKFDDDEWVE